MIQSIIVTNHLGESETMELARPEQSGFAVLSVEGLGPVKADISLTEMAAMDGSMYNSARAEPRNIVFRLRFLPKPDIETTRQKSYRYFPLKRRIEILFLADNRTVETYGYVESNEPDIFRSEEETIISVRCPEAYLYGETDQVTIFSSQTALFEFPFSNESLVSPLLEMSSISFETEKTVIYSGDAQIGILIHIHANGSANDIVITNSVTLETLTIDSAALIASVGADITAGDDFYISTVKGNKYATLIRGSTEYNILNCLGDNPTWFELDRGDNIFAFDADSGLSNLEFDITNRIAYEGI
jgi:hypothetical protein